MFTFIDSVTGLIGAYRLVYSKTRVSILPCDELRIVSVCVKYKENKVPVVTCQVKRIGLDATGLQLEHVHCRPDCAGPLSTPREACTAWPLLPQHGQ